MSRKSIDITGQRFGALVVLHRTKMTARNTNWTCKCDCGSTHVAASYSLRAGISTRCRGCAGNLLIPIEGQRFGKLVALHRVSTTKKNTTSAVYKCSCDCGNFTEVTGVVLRRGGTKSCGCHGKFGRVLPGAEAGFNRLFDSYKRGATHRGLAFNLTKEQFEIFTKQDCHYCGEQPTKKISAGKSKEVIEHHSYIYNGIDRIDNDAGYYRENCVPCCTVCNKLKSVFSYKEFLSHIDKIKSFTTKI